MTVVARIKARLWAAWARLRCGDPQLMRRMNGALALVWTVMIPISVVTGWIHSITYVSVLSLWALVAGHWAAWQAVRVEVAQQREMERRRDDPLEERIVHRFLAELGQYLATHAEEIEDAVTESAEEREEEAMHEAAARTSMM